MREIPPETLFDRRLVERHIRQGLITREQAEAYIQSLEDATELAEDLLPTAGEAGSDKESPEASSADVPAQADVPSEGIEGEKEV